jgi:NADH:ubiquinone oxidoreductase subunit 4 (subunit M)
MMMIAHGITSAILFFSVGVLYTRYHSRLITYYSGLTLVMPIFVSLFFFAILANCAIPGTFNFIGEYLIFLGLGHSHT